MRDFGGYFANEMVVRPKNGRLNTIIPLAAQGARDLDYRAEITWTQGYTIGTGFTGYVFMLNRHYENTFNLKKGSISF